jgi:selenocysteine lyase/cysteine desulfurase
MTYPRRQFLKSIGGASLGALVVSSWPIEKVQAATNKIKGMDARDLAKAEDYWVEVQKAYSPSKDFINLENGYYSLQPDAVKASLVRNIDMINNIPSLYMRKRQKQERASVKTALAEFAGCSPEELVICRNATEALEIIILGLDLREGDEAIFSDQDYPSMQDAFGMRARRYGIKTKVVSLPLKPETSTEIVRIYENAISPQTKIIMLSHMINITGQILPVKEICDMAHARGVDVLVDGAHSFAHVDFKIPELNCDFFGTSLHKWLCAPLGNGLLYIRKDKIKKVWPLYGDKERSMDDIAKFERQGTQPVHNILTISDALNFHNAIGSKRKEERLRYLKNYWIYQVKDLPNVVVNTPLKDQQSCGIANIAVKNKTSEELANILFEKYRIYTCSMENQGVKGIRVTPHLYTTLKDLDAFAKAVQEISQS